MAKTLQLDNLISPRDLLAEKLMATYDRWRVQRASWEAEKKELRNYLFATDTSTTSNNTTPWRNSTTIPKLCQIRDNLHAAYMDALFPNDEWFIWEGDDQSSVTKQKRTTIETYMRNKVKQSKLRETVSQLLYMIS